MNSDQEFREKVLVILTDVQTKMNSLVGVDGTKGRVGELEGQVKSLEAERSRLWGAGVAMTVLWTIAAAIAEHFRR